MKDVLMKEVIPYTVYFVILKLLITFLIIREQNLISIHQILTQNSISRFVSYKYFNVISNEYL